MKSFPFSLLGHGCISACAPIRQLPLLIPTIAFSLSAFFFGIANYFFIMNTRHKNHDTMGASISFDQPFALSNLFLNIGLCYATSLPWYLAILNWVVLEGLSMVYKWKILDNILEPFRKSLEINESPKSN